VQPQLQAVVPEKYLDRPVDDFDKKKKIAF